MEHNPPQSLAEFRVALGSGGHALVRMGFLGHGSGESVAYIGVKAVSPAGRTEMVGHVPGAIQALFPSLPPEAGDFLRAHGCGPGGVDRSGHVVPGAAEAWARAAAWAARCMPDSSPPAP